MLAYAMSHRRRLRSKTPPPTQAPVVGSDLGAEAPADAKLMAYLITFPHPVRKLSACGVPLVAPSSFTKRELAAKVEDAFAHPDSRNPASAGAAPVPLRRMGVWREWHAQTVGGACFQHDHTAALSGVSFRYLPVKRALLQRHGLASHWSQHTGYSSIVRYLAVPSPKKPAAALDHDPYLWDATGAHPPLVDCVYAPVTAKALEAKRRKLVNAACEAGSKDPRATDLDVWALVVRTGIRNTDDDRAAYLRLVAYAKENCDEAMLHYLWKRRNHLPTIIDDIWLWENAADAAASAARTRVQCLRVAVASACVCGGGWTAYVMRSLAMNGVDADELSRDVWSAFNDGRSETTPVIVLAGQSGGEGKSAFLKPLDPLFGGGASVFNVTKESGNFPLLDLPMAKVAFLDDFRFDKDLVSYATLCLWRRPRDTANLHKHLTRWLSGPIAPGSCPQRISPPAAQCSSGPMAQRSNCERVQRVKSPLSH